MSLACPLIVCAKDNPSAEGVCVSMDIISTPMKDGEGNITISNQVVCGVCWNDQRSPAISPHNAEDLEWLEVPGVTDSDEEEEDGFEPEVGGEEPAE